MYTLAQKITELKRELRMRKFVYPDMVKRDRLKPDVSEFRIAILEEIIDDLEALAGKEKTRQGGFDF